MTSITLSGSTPQLASVTASRAIASNDTSSVAQPAAPAMPAQPSTPSAPATTSGTGAAGGSFSTSIDPALGITVLKFFSSAGELQQSFPSQKQLASYQVYGLDKSGSTPANTSGIDGATGKATPVATQPVGAASGITASAGTALAAAVPPASALLAAAPASAAPRAGSATDIPAESAVAA